MENSKMWIMWLVGAVLIVIVVGFVIKNSAQNEEPSEAPVADQTTTPIAINTKHLYQNGTHTYRGIVQTPTPCYDVIASITQGPGSLDNKSIPVQTININTKDKGMNCVQAATDKEFKVSFEGPVDLPINVTLNGRPALLNIMEVESEAELEGAFDFKS
ncbi:MAG: hypothetical protein HZA95_01340 [Candidatus Vogelbacteria bacterium]|nr:hypothetical protein [Candidatus Vogelbacteria bacterium]